MKETNFSTVMEHLNHNYKTIIYVDLDYETEDAFVCPYCDDIITYESCGGVIEFDGVFYRCPKCKERF